MIASGSLPSVIDIHGITRRFGAKVALDDVSLSVPRGCVFGLVGLNGSGKTTLIKHILGLLRAESGSVRVFGATRWPTRSACCRAWVISPRRTTCRRG